MKVIKNDVINKIMEMQRRSVSLFPAADLDIKGSRYLSAKEFQIALLHSRKQDFFVGRKTHRLPNLKPAGSP